LISSLPLERAGAGSAVTNTVRQTGSVIGIAVGGTIMSIVYQRAIEPSLTDLPEPVRDRARISAEQARHVATAIHRPALAHAADDAFLHAMHVGAVWIMLAGLLGAAVLVLALRAAGSPVGPETEHESESVAVAVAEPVAELADERGGSRTTAERPSPSRAENRSAFEGDDVGSH
jgi:hypothetical protein